jgi:hypothetical protein
LPLTAAALALVAAGCGSTDHYNYKGYSDSQVVPQNVQAFSSGYVPFPASANESAGITGHSPYCAQHTSQPGCQTGDSSRPNRDNRRESNAGIDSPNATGAQGRY